MAIKVGINGLGRIGRMALRRLWGDPDFDVVAANSRSDASMYAYLLKYDSSYSTWDREVTFKGKNEIIIDGKSIKLTHQLDPAKIGWDKLGVEIVAESTGAFRDREGAAQHLKGGANRVVISAPGKGEDVTLVPGVNMDDFKPEHKIISAASCTTNCLGPIIKIIHENIGIIHGSLVTIHAYTNDQPLFDSPHKKGDLRRSRSAVQSIVPTSTGAAYAIGKIIPEIEGKLDGIAMRVPVEVGSVTSTALELKKKTTVKEVNQLFAKAAKQKHWQGILDYTEIELVSHDYLKNPYACIVDGPLTKVTDGTHLNVVGWYDNEWGYINQFARVIKHVGSK